MPRHGGRNRTASFSCFLIIVSCQVTSFLGIERSTLGINIGRLVDLDYCDLSESRIAPKPSLLGLMWRPTAAERSKDGTFKSSKHGIKLLWAVDTHKRPVAQYAIPPVALCIFFFLL
ncbi:hypothetical protein V8C43DRAFT_291042 [Trichoderma afarasin]